MSASNVGRGRVGAQTRRNEAAVGTPTATAMVLDRATCVARRLGEAQDTGPPTRGQAPGSGSDPGQERGGPVQDVVQDGLQGVAESRIGHQFGGATQARDRRLQQLEPGERVGLP